MQSRAAIGGHPIHPMLVPLPIGAFFVGLVGDLVYLRTHDLFWYGFSRWSILVGILTALAAAVAGLVDYLGVDMPARARPVANWHLTTNLSVVALEAVSFWLRARPEIDGLGRWPLAAGLSLVAFAGLLVAGWLGGELAYRHRIGVVETHAEPTRQTAHRSRAA